MPLRDISTNDTVKLRNSTSRSTNRFIVESDSFIVPPLEDRQFDRRSSRRRSSMGKHVIPRLSVANFFSRPGHTIKFDVDQEEEKTRKTPKFSLSSNMFDPALTHQKVRESLELKMGSRIFDGVQFCDLQSRFEASSRTCFSGDMHQKTSSKFTESDAPVVPWSITNSQFVSIGDSSDASLEAIWPWPWLPCNLSSSEYISKSKLQTTFSRQDELQVFPILPLSQTLETFSRSVRLFLRPNQLKEMEELLDHFTKTHGKSLHDRLTKEYLSLVETGDKCNMNWLQRLVPSVTMCLTRLEAPLVNTSILAPFMWDLWPQRPDSQIDRAVILIQTVAEFARLVYSERLNVFYDEAGYPQCNHQFRKLFASSKIPGIPSDATHCFFKTLFEAAHNSSPKHIIVICRGQMFSLDIMMDEQRTLPTTELNMCLQQIVKAAGERKRATCLGVGILSSMDRDVWSETRVHLMEISAKNRACLQNLEEAMFVLTLDHVKARGPDWITNEAIFADGCNRWYDKGLSFYIFQNGLVTVSVCSSIVDGSIVNSLLRFIHIRILEDAERWDDEVYKKSGLTSRCVSSEMLTCAATLSQFSDLALVPDSNSELALTAVSSNESRHPCILTFDLDETLQKCITEAKFAFTQLSENLSSAMCQYEGFEMNFFEDLNINLDAFAHLAIQLTFFKMYFRPAAVGSKMAIRRFYHTHYDTMTTTTEESIAWCRAMLSSDSPLTLRRDLFWAAVKRHVAKQNEILSGHGCFLQLLALREMASIMCDDASLKTLDDMSELPCGSLESMDIGCEELGPQGYLSVAVVIPPSLTSYGVGYALAKAKAVFTVCSWKNNPGTCAEIFSRSLHRCLGELRGFLLRL